MSSYKHYIIKQGDTLQSIAQTLYSDIGEWRMLVNLNHLHYPYIVKTAQQKMNDPEHLLTYGDKLLLPNDDVQLKVSGNYAVRIYHEDHPEETEPRVYALDRVKELGLTDKKWHFPKDFDANKFFSGHFGVDHQGEPEHVRIRVDARTAQYMNTLPLHHSQKEELRTPE